MLAQTKQLGKALFVQLFNQKQTWFIKFDAEKKFAIINFLFDFLAWTLNTKIKKKMEQKTKEQYIGKILAYLEKDL